MLSPIRWESIPWSGQLVDAVGKARSSYKSSFGITMIGFCFHMSLGQGTPTQGTNHQPTGTAYDADLVAKLVVVVVVVNDTQQSQPNPSETTWHVQHREPVALIE